MIPKLTYKILPMYKMPFLNLEGNYTKQFALIHLEIHLYIHSSERKGNLEPNKKNVIKKKDSRGIDVEYLGYRFGFSKHFSINRIRIKQKT